MSWDIFVQDFPSSAKTVEEIPDDYKPPVIGKRSEIIDRIVEIVPIVDFSDPSWGVIEGRDWSIEVNIGSHEACEGFVLHVRGGDAAAGAVGVILEQLGLRAIDSQSGRFFVAGEEAVRSFREWKRYRNDIVEPGSE
jgi:hypothetical protein